MILNLVDFAHKYPKAADVAYFADTGTAAPVIGIPRPSAYDPMSRVRQSVKRRKKKMKGRPK